MTYVLERNAPRGVQIVGTFFLALLLAALAIPALLYAPGIPISIIGGAFAIVSLLLAFSAVKQLFALRTPQTIVEMDVETLTRGTEVQLSFRQPGTGSFESVRANLVGEERWFERGYGTKRSSRMRELGTFNLFDSGPFDAPWQATVRVRIPDLPHAEETHGEYWRLEVWGKVRGRADFQHVYDLRVHRSASR